MHQNKFEQDLCVIKVKFIPKFEIETEKKKSQQDWIRCQAQYYVILRKIAHEKIEVNEIILKGQNHGTKDCELNGIFMRL